MSRFIQLFLLTATLFTLSACSTIEVSQDYDPKADFTKINSFEWLPAEKQTKPKASDFEKKNPLIAKRIEAAIESELKLKGKTFKDSQADAFVTYHISSLQKIHSSPVTTSVGVGRGWGAGYGSIGFQTSPDVRQYEEGQLLIDVLDKNGNLMWRGKATSPLEEHPTPEETTKHINEAVQKLMSQFPPK